MAGIALHRVATALLFLVIAACGEPDGSGAGDLATENPSPTATEEAATSTSTVSATASPSPSATHTPEGWIALPTQELVGAEMDALLSGQLVEEDDCLWVAPDFPEYTGENYLIVWPLGYTAQDEDGQFVVRDATGEVVALAGDEIYMGGGSVGRGSHGDQCSGQLRIAGSTVRTGPPPTPHPSAMGTYLRRMS